MNFVIDDRVAEYNRELESFIKLRDKAKADILAEHKDNVSLIWAKLQQKKNRLEALGVKLTDGS